MTLTLNLPDALALRHVSEAEMRLELACALHAQGRISKTAGAEMAELDLFAFQEALGERQISTYTVDDLHEEVNALRSMLPVKTFIRHTPGVCGGEACIRMTRIAVWMLEEARRARATDTDLLADYPDLTREDLDAAWQYVGTHEEEIENAIRGNNGV